MTVLSCSKNNCLKMKWHLELAKLMTWGDSHGGVVQLQPSSSLPGRHNKAHCSHKDGENKTWIWSPFFLHILYHICSHPQDQKKIHAKYWWIGHPGRNFFSRYFHWLGQFSHRVAMSVCVSVCLFAPSGAVFFEDIGLWEVGQKDV